jgi:hypothetical protein
MPQLIQSRSRQSSYVCHGMAMYSGINESSWETNASSSMIW